MLANQHINFLRKCKQNGVIPHGMQMNNTTNINRNTILLNSTMKKLRNNTLEWQYKRSRLLSTDIATNERILRLYMVKTQPQRDHELDLSWINKHDKKKNESVAKRHEKKIKELVQQQVLTERTSRSGTNIDTSNVVNKSNTALSQSQLAVLSKGLKYVPTPKSINVVNVIANTEQALRSAPHLTKQLAISEISTFIRKWKKPKRDNLTREERIALKEIKNMKTVTIVQADKGGKVVVIDADDYTRKIEEKLADTALYEAVGDPTKIIKRKISELAERLFKANRITQAQKYELSSIDYLPRIRGQPKLHKLNNPMRIVTCSRNTITSPLSRFAFSLIRQLRETIEHTVSNTNKFIDEISKVRLEKDDRLASLDIEDLYTNVPVGRAVDIAINRIGASEKFCESNLTKTDVKQILLVALNNSYFQFNGRFYRQKRGLPMGNTISPILADLYMHDYMEKNMNQVCQPNRLWRYVDDILLVSKMNEKELQDYVNRMNSIKSSIRFTFEYEKNERLSFLDTLLSRHNNEKIKIRWFRKETASDRLLNYHSAHQKSIKQNIVSNMATRIIETSKEPEDQKTDLDKLKTMMMNSGYPSYEVNKQIEDTMRRINDTNTEKKEKKDEFNHVISLPYVDGIGVLKRKLENLKIKVYFSYPDKIQSTCSNSMKPQSKSNIYQITCDCGAVYNGETKVGFQQRISQHRKAIEKDEETSLSEMVQHHHEKRYQCLFDTENAFIIDSEVNRHKRRVKEAIYSNINGSINRRDDIDKMWTPLLCETGQGIKNTIAIRQRTFQEAVSLNLQDGDSGTEEED